ncbi:hypothetical protein VTH82DRAFT_8339 [Thermothelomyces myriococcoides]
MDQLSLSSLKVTLGREFSLRDAASAALPVPICPPCEVAAASAPTTTEDDKNKAGGQEENEFIKTFKESCEFTSGYGVFYQPNAVNWSPSHPAQSDVIHPEGTRLVPGRLLTIADVTRVVDANVVHLEQEVPLNGSFRLFVFAGNPAVTARALRDLADNMTKRNSFYAAYAFEDAERRQISHHERHNPHSAFFTICTIFAAPRASIEITRDVPPLLARYRDHVYADDRWDRRAPPDARACAHAKMGIDQDRGAVVVVRPDGYVGIVVALREGPATVDALNAYFGAFCTKKLGGDYPRAQL